MILFAAKAFLLLAFTSWNAFASDLDVNEVKTTGRLGPTAQLSSSVIYVRRPNIPNLGLALGASLNFGVSRVLSLGLGLRQGFSLTSGWPQFFSMEANATWNFWRLADGNHLRLQLFLSQYFFFLRQSADTNVSMPYSGVGAAIFYDFRRAGMDMGLGVRADWAFNSSQDIFPVGLVFRTLLPL